MNNLLPVSNLGILLIIERAAATHDRDGQEIVLFRRGRSIPLQSKGIPRIGTSLLSILQSVDDIVDEDQYRDTDKEGSNRRQQIHLIPTQIGRIGIDAARHTQQTQHMHGEEGQIETNHREPEMPLTHALIEHLASYLREPV